MKLYFQLTSYAGGEAAFILQPNNIAALEVDTVGIVQNGKVILGPVDTDKQLRVPIYIPSDWSLWFVYSQGFAGGRLDLKYNVLDYEDGDEITVIEAFQPTLDTHIT